MFHRRLRKVAMNSTTPIAARALSSQPAFAVHLWWTSPLRGQRLAQLAYQARGQGSDRQRHRAGEATNELTSKEP
jgi:hypothetical protein